MSSTLTSPPRRDNPFNLPGTLPSLDDRTAWRRWATRESRARARTEISSAGPLIPEPTATQAVAEAQIMAALLDEYGVHRPFTTGGPYGIASVTPRQHELRVRLADGQLEHWAPALVAALGTKGPAGPHTTVSDDGLVVAHRGARIELLDVTQAQWKRAVETVPSHSGSPRHVLDHGLVQQLSATLRRIGLLWDVAQRFASVELLLAQHADRTYLLDASPGPHAASVLPLWTALSLPLELWPCPPAPAAIDPRAAVLAAVNAAPPFPNASDPALALCHLAGIDIAEISLRAADQALSIAQTVLADPAYTTVWDGGGWAGNCRRRSGRDDYAAYQDEFLPPGTERLLNAPGIDIEELGRLVLRPQLDLGELTGDEVHEVPLSWGTSALIDLLDWALAAVTSPSHQAPVQLTAVGTGLPAAARYAAAQITAAHEAIEDAATRPRRRHGYTHRLVQPVPVVPDADPTLTDLILAAHERDVLNIIPFLAGLAYLTGKVPACAGSSDGHWDHEGYSNSFTGTIGGWTGAPPATLASEEANTAPVDSAAFRRHLAAHRAALDPFVVTYLAAADSLTGEVDLASRHRAGAQALREADLAELQAHDPRQRPEDNHQFLRLLASVPADLHELREWCDTLAPHTP
ncbi:hypothetical protein SMD44_p10027 (plasmid) [Streptomyces alboflavus]|uniref:Uncharacterized protein n=1 Tax=Streptomyces alboflavus TaxID=67267 RepID=A0A291W4E5_9ACTN|nr:hypothetical protein [Streptomyces alboflavus]ATM24526.1 hypothetical protein SMD44_p10027 [Streptomyces alboflavus]